MSDIIYMPKPKTPQQIKRLTKDFWHHMRDTWKAEDFRKVYMLKYKTYVLRKTRRWKEYSPGKPIIIIPDFSSPLAYCVSIFKIYDDVVHNYNDDELRASLYLIAHNCDSVLCREHIEKPYRNWFEKAEALQDLPPEGTLYVPKVMHFQEEWNDLTGKMATNGEIL